MRQTKAPTPAATMPGVIVAQVMEMRRLYCQVDMAVPQTAALLLVPTRWRARRGESGKHGGHQNQPATAHDGIHKTCEGRSQRNKDRIP